MTPETAREAAARINAAMDSMRVIAAPVPKPRHPWRSRLGDSIAFTVGMLLGATVVAGLLGLLVHLLRWALS